jgi:hypothetical protein
MPSVVSVNVGIPKSVPYETTSLPTTGIEKDRTVNGVLLDHVRGRRGQCSR